MITLTKGHTRISNWTYETRRRKLWRIYEHHLISYESPQYQAIRLRQNGEVMSKKPAVPLMGYYDNLSRLYSALEAN